MKKYKVTYSRTEWIEALELGEAVDTAMEDAREDEDIHFSAERSDETDLGNLETHHLDVTIIRSVT